MNMETDTHALELSVAEIKGMLTATLARHDQRLDQHEGTLTQIDERVRIKGNLLARHDERIKDLEADNDARYGKTLGTMGLIISILVACLAVYNRFTLGG